MKLIHFLYRKEEHWGILEGKLIRFLKQAPYRKITLLRKKIPWNEALILAPANPSKIILVGLNYRDHAREMAMEIPKEPVIFLKPPSSMVAHNQPIFCPPQVKRLDYEAELALIVAKTAKNTSPAKALSHILGYTCLNDVTARDLQKKDGQWARAKSFDTFCPLGPYLETDLNTADLNIETRLNGKLKQSSNTKQLIFSVAHLFSFISKIMTLHPGDIISTGTPGGIGPMKDGDIVEVSIEGVGVLKNPVKAGGGS
jgi:2-keto-4-pentenoate hydratase/2-oxohepta-3-ene-1,7-dioic acid hydratase in catechol pathway